MVNIIIRSLLKKAAIRVLKMPRDPNSTIRITNPIHSEVKTQKINSLKPNGTRKIGKANGTTKRNTTKMETTKIKNGKVNTIKKETHMVKHPQNKDTMDHNKKERNTIKVKESMDVGSNRLF